MVEEVREGGCQCGDVRYRVVGAPIWTAFCHCESCRRSVGAPVTAYAGFLKERFAVTRGALTRYRSSPGVERGFCGRCGTSLTFRSERWAEELHIHLASLDDPESLPPVRQAFAEERLSWLCLEAKE